ncbi:MAG: HEPN domain-containing protein [Candidatus Sumerlaeota bacterium]|nr:HEPN domain-containing protein [Candidatus Sumerlaeota bacterium]
MIFKVCDGIMDIQKQIDYWRKGAEEDFAAAQTLLEKDHLRHGMFFAHLAVEKMLKAHVVKATQNIPPKIHSLTLLAEKTSLVLDSTRLDFLKDFNLYQMEGRYPYENRVWVDSVQAQRDMAAAREMLEWLKAQL